MFSKPLSILLAALCSAAAVGASGLATFLLRPDWVDRLDAAWLERYEAPAREGLESAEALLAEGREDEAIAVARALFDSLRPVQKTDRLEPIKIRVAQWLLARYDARRERAPALAVLEATLAMDPLHLPLRLRHVDLLLADPATEADGRRELEELFRALPTAPAVASRRMFLAAADGDLGRGVEAAYALHRSAGASIDRPSSWQVYWSEAGVPFSGQRRTYLEAQLVGPQTVRLTGRWTLDAPSLSSIRFDFPPYLAIAAFPESVRLATASTSLSLALRTGLPGSYGVERCDDFLVSSGQIRSSAVIPVDGRFAAGDGVDLTVELRLEPALPPALWPLAEPSRVARLASDLDASHQTAAHYLLKAASLPCGKAGGGS